MNDNEKDRIITATVQELKEFGIKGTNLDLLVKKLGVSKKTIYQFFENKEGLLAAAMDHEFQDSLRDLKVIAGIKMPKNEQLWSSLLLISQRLYEVSCQVKKELSSHALLHREFNKGVERTIDYLVATYFQGQVEYNRILLLSLIDIMVKGANHEMGSTTELHIREHVIPFYLKAWENRIALGKNSPGTRDTSHLDACTNS